MSPVERNNLLVRVLWGLHTCLINAGELVPALEHAKEMRQLADALGIPSAIVESLHALGTTLAFMGNLTGAREVLERASSLSPIAEHVALDKAVTSVDLANRLTHPPSLAYATFWAGWIRHARGEYAEACRQFEAAIEMSVTYGLPQFVEWARVLRGSSLAHVGRTEVGISEMRRSLDNQLAMRCLLERPFCLTLLAEALHSDGQSEEALALCDEALQIADRTEGRSYEAEARQLREQILRRLAGR